MKNAESVLKDLMAVVASWESVVPAHQLVQVRADLISSAALALADLIEDHKRATRHINRMAESLESEQ